MDAPCQDSASGSAAAAKHNKDLISFEEEAELVPSRSVSPNGVQTNLVIFHSVVSLFPFFLMWP